GCRDRRLDRALQRSRDWRDQTLSARAWRGDSRASPAGREPQLKIALIVSDFNFDVTSLMLERARRHAEFLGAEVSHVVHVPRVFDMGPAVKKLIERKEVDGVVLIGAVIKGETQHDEVVVHGAANA